MSTRGKYRLFLTVILSISLAGCGGDDPTPDGRAEDQAEATITGFFDHLLSNRYAEAAELYGGSYEALVEANPDTDPQNRAALLDNACNINGFQCLRPMSVTLQTSSADTFDFLVEFETADGSLFSLGPCCGDDESTPPQTEFAYTVVANGLGGFLVQELPPYMP
jgi:hypothetical protein